MTKLLEKAVAAVRQLPSDNQDEIAATMLRLADEGLHPEDIDPAHKSAVLEGLEQSRRREFASEAEIERAFNSFRE
jgi:hypothetical protein